MFLVDIGGYIFLTARNELPREVSDAGSDFEHAFSHEGANRIGHPAIELWGMGKGVQDGLLGILVEAAAHPVAEDDGQRLNRVPETGFLALLIGAAMIADGRLINARPSFGELDGDFGLDAEPVAANGYARHQSGAKRLVAGFHVGEVEVGNDIADGRQDAVGERMPEIEDAPLAADHEPG